jgi:hypothetical protein
MLDGFKGVQYIAHVLISVCNLLKHFSPVSVLLFWAAMPCGLLGSYHTVSIFGG